MTERRQLAILAALSVGTLTCFGWLLLCPHRADCLNALTRFDTWLSAGTTIAVPLAGASVAVWLALLVWRLLRVGFRLRALPRSRELPAGLVAAMSRTGVRRVGCLAADAPIAFCAGAISPGILVSEGLVARLRPDELDAVLLHEHEHVRTNEPLLRAAHETASDVLFYVPLIRWWSRYRLEDSELRADRAALERLGPRPVAAALWALGRSVAMQGVAAFGGVAELRVAQLLGDALPTRAPGLPLVAISGMGTYLALQVASCLVQAAQRLT
jgi:Zn-dependent protease with chaperone function